MSNSMSNIEFAKRLTCCLLWIIFLPIRLAISAIGTVLLPLIAVVGTIISLHDWACKDNGAYPDFSLLKSYIVRLYWDFLVKSDWSVLS